MSIFTFAGLISENHNFIIMFHTVLCAVLMILMGLYATRNVRVVPTGMQNLHEWVIGGILSIARSTMEDKLARKYFPLAGTIGIFVFYCNVIGIIPGFESPTSSVNFTLTLALVVFFYYHYEGIKSQGVGKYFSHFLGPVSWLYPLMFPIEVISHISRIISLSFRLFGNIKGDDMFLIVILQLVPWIAPLLPYSILAFMAVLQAFVFMILTYVYIASAIMVDEH